RRSRPPPAGGQDGRVAAARPGGAGSACSTGRMKFILLSCFLLSFPAHAQEKENFDRLMPAMGALERGDIKQAIDSLRPLAADGTVEAQYTLATILETALPPLRDL